MAKNTSNIQQEMEEIYRKAADGTPFVKFLYFEIISLLTDRSYSSKALRKKLFECHPKINRETLNPDLNQAIKNLKKIEYIEVSDSKNNILHATKKGIDAYLEITNKIKELIENSSQTIIETMKRKSYEILGNKVRKSSFHDYHDYHGIDPGYLSKWYPEVTSRGIFEKNSFR
jgi:hypothetical protein